MRPIRLALTVIFTLLALLPGLAFAWGPPGHRIIASRAEAQLRPAALAEARRLLALDGATHLSDVANWADEQRDSSAPGMADTRQWHYVNFKDGCEYVPPRDCPDGKCVVAAINRQLLVLGDRRRPDVERRDALKYLVHLVGDAHQPLHASSRDDKGGNDYQLSVNGTGTNLHQAWDRLLLQRALSVAGSDEAGYPALLAALPPLPADPTRHSDRATVEWALESCRIVRDGNLYPTGHSIGNEYLDAHRTQMQQRLREAGDRLADMLNDALDPLKRAARP